MPSPVFHLSVKGHEGMLSKFPAGVDELHFQSGSTIKNLAQLRKLFDLFAEILQQLCHEGKAYEDDVRIHMRRLRAPGGRIRDKYVIWEGDEPRRAAAIALGRLRDPVAGPALTSVLKDKDTMLIARAVEALARIGDARAIGPLVRRLGDRRPIREYVAEALRQLGEGDLADTVHAALGGDFGRLKSYSGAYRGRNHRGARQRSQLALRHAPGERACRNPRRGSAATAPRSPQEPGRAKPRR